MSYMPLFFTKEEVEFLDGAMQLAYEKILLKYEQAREAAQEVERQHKEFKGISDPQLLKWAISVVASRVWIIPALPGRTMVPFADMLNHNHEKSVALDIRPELQVGIIRSKYYYPKGSEFFVKYYVEKVDSDTQYFMAFGFLLNNGDVSTFQINFNYDLAHHPNVKDLIDRNNCATDKPVLTDQSTLISAKFIRCLEILSLQSEADPNHLSSANYTSLITPAVTLRALQWAETYFNEEMAKFKKSNHNLSEKAILANPNLTQNMKNILLVQRSEYNILMHGRDLVTKQINEFKL